MFLFHDWLPLDFVFRYNSSVLWWKINSKQSISTWVNQKKIESSKKEYVMWTWFKFWPMKNIFENYEPMRVWLWVVYKSAENFCRFRLFAELIQTQKRYSTSLDKVRILTWKLLISSENFSFELNSLRTYSLQDISYLSLRP